VYTELLTIIDLIVSASKSEQISDRRLVKKRNVAIPQVKIKWTHLPGATSTWEDYNVLKARFPSSLAWGQASSSVGGDVTPASEE
jgi:hypothetical protein